MKTISVGKKHIWWVGKQATCRNCDTKAEVEAGDPVRHGEEPGDRNEGSTFYVELPCPTCRQPIRFYNSRCT